MKIKESTSVIAAQDFDRVVDEIGNRYHICESAGHDFVCFVHQSSYLISRFTSLNGQGLLDKIAAIGQASPSHFIWAVRTTSPKNFPLFMGNLQQQSIDYLRAHSYVSVFDSKRQFLNHAKFLSSYHVCFSEEHGFHGLYFGSTNFTQVGMSVNPKGRGNYEEFTSSYKSLNKPRSSDIDSVRELLEHVIKLYESDEYRSLLIKEHLRYLQKMINTTQLILSRTTIVELYGAYLDLISANSRSISLLSELPGKEQTSNILEKISDRNDGLNAYNSEMLFCDEEYFKEMASVIGMNEDSLRSKVLDLLLTAHNVIKFLKTEYLSKTRDISLFLNESETQFMKLIEYSKEHLKYLHKATSLSKTGKWKNDGHNLSEY